MYARDGIAERAREAVRADLVEHRVHVAGRHLQRRRAHRHRLGGEHGGDDALRQEINQTLRRELSPRHVPDAIFQVSELPYTLSGKKLEIPVRRILLGHPVEKAANLGAMRNPESINFFVELAQKLAT